MVKYKMMITGDTQGGSYFGLYSSKLRFAQDIAQIMTDKYGFTSSGWVLQHMSTGHYMDDRRLQIIGDHINKPFHEDR